MLEPSTGCRGAPALRMRAVGVLSRHPTAAHGLLIPMLRGGRAGSAWARASSGGRLKPPKGGRMDAVQCLKQEHEKAKAEFAKVLSAPPTKRGELWEKLEPELKFHEQIGAAWGSGPVAHHAGA